MDQAFIAAIIEAEQQRCDAMLRNDGEALIGLLDPRLVFAHATGSLDDKLSYLAKMAEGKIEYLAIDWSDPQVTKLGDDHGLLTGRMSTRVRVAGVEKHLDNRVTTVWARGHDIWRMLAFQSTPIKP